MSQTVQSESFRGIAAVTVCVWEGGLRGQVTPALLYVVMFCHFVSRAETLRRLDFEVKPHRVALSLPSWSAAEVPAWVKDEVDAK